MKDLQQIKSSFDAFIRKRLILWFIRWSIGFLLIAVTTYYFPTLGWLWYIGLAIAVVSLFAYITADVVLSGKLATAGDSIHEFQQELLEHQDLGALIRGRWKTVTTVEGVKTTAISRFEKDGTFVSNMAFSGHGFSETCDIEGKWSVEGRHRDWRVEKSTNPELIPIGFKSRDEILSVSYDKIIYRDENGLQSDERIGDLETQE